MMTSVLRDSIGGNSLTVTLPSVQILSMGAECVLG